MPHYLGIDGGGTKTAFLLIDETGARIAESRQRTCYYFGTERGIQLVGDVLADGLADIEAQSGVTRDQLDFVFYAMPGYGEASADVPTLDAIPAPILGHDRYRCGNDMISGWAGSLGAADGINVIAGTGSMAYGERAGVSHRTGGWSEIFGDEGSAYWIAVRALGAFSRMADGRLPRTALHGMMRERLGVADDLDAIGVIVGEWASQRGLIADLSKVATAAAAAGDPVAQQILVDAQHELAAQVAAVRAGLAAPDDETIPVSYSGGVFAAPGFVAGFAAALEETGLPFELRAPLHDPSLGAALYALRLSGAAVPTVPTP
ncbi:N-acetylglucosamine kinase [Schumannella sp. 10F1B-5-1]|uniref:N-acetylglucosamine kinase n=1 Tax=Schumannella sp. 10F1B-5-1 TaxID=2590780 RepID=UPI00113227E2|nr:BadF/BadG/BcrA/BcrD ATPase family protein [Schumannella sp. 10F1B-5-1]TPW71549.1 N-acetylglucosamine kinase [Schumannella sp. 10F1B-5-1]